MTENIYTYKNAFHTDDGKYGPEYYKTTAEPIEYKGYTIYNRTPGVICDIVRKGECIGQMVTIRAAKNRIDAVTS